MALDKHGKLWFLEVNAKPGKDTIALGYGEDIFVESFVHPLEYARFLTGFTEVKGSKEETEPSGSKGHGKEWEWLPDPGTNPKTHNQDGPPGIRSFLKRFY